MTISFSKRTLFILWVS